MRISIIGSGTVGLGVGKGLIELGNDVIFYDIDDKVIEELNNKNLNATKDLDYAIKNSDISFLCVPTPTVNGSMDLSCIKTVVESLATALKSKEDYHVIVIKSTILPTTTEEVIRPLLEQFSGKICGVDFGLCTNPDFSTEVHQSWTSDLSAARDFFTQERIVIGEFDKKAGDIVEEIFKPLGIPVFRTDLKTAELIKYAANSALASRISYWNEIFYICNQLDIDSNFVAEVVSMDKRIGKYGSIHGKAFGGPCLQKDLQAFFSFAQKIGYKPILLKAVHNINEKIKKDRGVRE